MNTAGRIGAGFEISANFPLEIKVTLNKTSKTFRLRFGIKALIALVAVFALLFGALRFSRDTQPAYLYAGWLIEGDHSRRLHAAQELGGVNEQTPVVVASLIRALLTDQANDVRTESARSLGRIVSQREDGPMTADAVRALVRALSDKDPVVRAAVAEAIGRIAPQPDQAVPDLLRVTHDDDGRVRGAAIAAIGLIQGKAGVDQQEVRLAIVTAMNDPSLHVRELGIYALWAIAEKKPGFSRALLSDSDLRARRAAVTALARSGPLAEKVAQELTACLTDPDAAVRAGAARALTNMGMSATPETEQ